MEQSKNFSILVVEDDRYMLDAIRIILEEEGYNILTAENGEEALVSLQTNPHPDLILLDMIMPKMNGWDFAKAYREKYEKRSPIVVITGAADAAQRAKDVEAAAWMSKPYEIQDIIEMVGRFS